jgi:hypothetical protein
VGNSINAESRIAGARVVAEDEKRRAVAANLRHRQAVHHCAHCVFADAVMQVLAAGRAGLEIAGTFEG